jgi:hypothetical protein
MYLVSDRWREQAHVKPDKTLTIRMSRFGVANDRSMDAAVVFSDERIEPHQRVDSRRAEARYSN